ncbi:MAG: 2-oxo acid dehydrogenase subunit E2 [Candidatus Lokiarchaeota archaeon]|nr:2-oxo acid dehydrogenase subunit E2 [Candidatus Lokiarchaeota archaeon]
MDKKGKLDLIGKYSKKEVPRVAQVVDDYLTIARKINSTVWGMSYIDVTDARKLIREHYKKTGYNISFTAFLITCYSRAVEKFKYPVNTFHRRMKYYYTFEDVDVQTNIERTLPSGIKKPLNYTIRKANTKTLKEINDEIQAAKQTKPEGVSTHKQKTLGIMKIFPKFPRFLRRIIIYIIFRNPLIRKRLLGTVGLTAVGMLAKEGIRGFGHGIFITPHTMSIAVAGIENRQMVIDGKPVIRETIAITLAMDHRIIDGGPATRFGTEFFDIVENQYKEADWCFKSL